MANRLDTRTLIRQAISQTDITAGDFSETELNGFIDISVRHLGALVKKPIKRTSFQVTVDTATYAIATVASDLILPTKAYFGNTGTPGDVRSLRIVPEEELAELNPAWLDADSTSQGRPAYLVRDGANILIHPRPNTLESVTGKKVYLSYVYQPAALTDDVTALDLPIVYHDLVAKYAEHFCYLGKLNNHEKGLAIKAQVIIDAKKLEPTIIKESESPGFHWGMSVDPEEHGLGVIL